MYGRPGFTSGCWVVEVEIKFLVSALIENQHTTSCGLSPPSPSREARKVVYLDGNHAWASNHVRRGYSRERSSSEEDDFKLSGLLLRLGSTSRLTCIGQFNPWDPGSLVSKVQTKYGETTLGLMNTWKLDSSAEWTKPRQGRKLPSSGGGGSPTPFLRHFARLCASTEKARQGLRVHGRGLGFLPVVEGGSPSHFST